MPTIHDPAPPRRWTRLVGVPVAAVSLACLAACGAGAATGSSSGSSSGSSTGGSDTAMQAFASCMAENGVTLPQRGSGGAGGGGTDGGSPPSGAPAAGGAGSNAAGSGSAGSGGAPRAGGHGRAMAAPPGVDATTWAAAQKACAQYAPTRPDGAAQAG